MCWHVTGPIYWRKCSPLLLISRKSDFAKADFCVSCTTPSFLPSWGGMRYLGLSIVWRGSVQGPECGLYSQKRCLGPTGLLCRLTLLLSQVWTEIWVGRYQAHLSFLPLCLILLPAAPLPRLSPPPFSFLLLLFLLLLLSPTLPSSPFWVEAQFRLLAWALDSARAVPFPLHLSVRSEGH